MIVKTPNPVLTTPARKITKVDRKVIDIINQMKTTLVSADKPKGVGLAAPQIGVPLRIFITKPTQNAQIRVFINPEITWKSEVLQEIKRPQEKKKSVPDEKKLEGCLSIPNVWGYLKRSEKLKLKYMDLEGKEQEEEFDGFMATIIQHETDHVNGILFTQKVLEQKQKLYRIREMDNGDEELVEMKI